MPDRFRAWGDRWVELNPGWTLREWGDDDLGWLANRALFEHLGGMSRAAQADIARYEILLREGGLYVDTDVEPLRPLGDVLGDVDAVLVEQFTGFLNNAVMAAVSGHPLLARLVGELEDSARARAGDGFMEMISPGYLNRTFNRWWAEASEDQRATVKVLDRDVTHPYSWHQRHLGAGPFGDAVAVHHWAVSWAGSGGGSVRDSGARAVRAAVVGVRRGWRTADATIRRGLHRVATVGERQPHPRRRHLVAPLDDGRLLVHSREGVVLFADTGDAAAVSQLTRDGTLDPEGIRLLRRLLQPGDTYVHLGPGSGLEPVVAAWAVGVTGRSVARCASPRAHELLLASEAVNRADGMHPTLLAVPSESWPGVASALRGAAELRLVRAPAGPDQAELVTGLLPAVREGRVRHLDLELSDARAAEGRGDLNSLLLELAQSPGVRSERLDPRGRLVPLELAAAVHHAEVPHLLVTFARPA